MTEVKAALTAQHSNVELFKTANRTASFIVEAMLDFQANDGRVYNKVVIVIVKRLAQNKAIATVRYFMDVTLAKVLFHDLWIGELPDEHSEYKVLHGTERALFIKPLDNGTYRFSVMNKSEGLSESLYFDLSRFAVRCLARAILDHLQAWQLANAIYKRKGM